MRRPGVHVHPVLRTGHLDLDAYGLSFEERSQPIFGLREGQRGCRGRGGDEQAEGGTHDDKLWPARWLAQGGGVGQDNGVDLRHLNRHGRRR